MNVRVALIFTTEGRPVPFAFVYAMQIPRLVMCLKLRAHKPALPCTASLQGMSMAEAWGQYFAHEFRIEPNRFVGEHELRFDPCDTEVHILPSLQFMGGGRVVSNADLVPLHEFPAGKDGPEHEEESAGHDVMSKISPDLMDKHPWLAKFAAVSKPHSVGERSQSSSSGCKARVEVEPLDEEQAIAAFDALREKRVELAASGPDELPHDFTLQILGGSWTQAHKGVPFDAVKARAATPSARAWAKQYGLNAEASFAFRKYGERVATMLATAWNHQMQFFLTSLYRMVPVI